MDRTATRKDPLLNTETYTYENNGSVATVTDRKSQVTTYTYDALNRRTKATYHDSTSTNYTYDAGNRITQVQEKDAGNNVTATLTRAYDGLDRLTQEVTAQGQLDYVYDNASRPQISFGLYSRGGSQFLILSNQQRPIPPSGGTHLSGLLSFSILASLHTIKALAHA